MPVHELAWDHLRFQAPYYDLGVVSGRDMDEGMEAHLTTRMRPLEAVPKSQTMCHYRFIYTIRSAQPLYPSKVY